MLKVGIVLICILSIGFIAEAQPTEEQKKAGPPPGTTPKSGGKTGSPPSGGSGTGGPPSGGPPGGSGSGGPTSQGSCDGLCGDGLNFYYNEYYEGDNHIIESNGIPNHAYHQNRQTPNPAKVCEQDRKYTFPKNPVKLAAPVATPFGSIGILKTGAAVFNHKSNMNGVNDVANHESNEAVSLDNCAGHANKDCTYHYHEISMTDVCAFDETFNHCEWIGTMFDGFRLYSHCKKTDGNYLKSCYKLTGTGGESTSDYTFDKTGKDCDLDEANGYDFTGKGIKDSEGNLMTGYHYVAIQTYPWTSAYLYGDAKSSYQETTTYSVMTSSYKDTTNNFNYNADTAKYSPSSASQGSLFKVSIKVFIFLFGIGYWQK